MPLRGTNNPDTAPVIMGVLKSVLNQDAQGNYNTALAQSSQSGTGAELVFIQQKYKMSLALTPTQLYAVHLSSGKQHYSYAGGPRSREGLITILVEYYSRWDVQPNSIDAIWTYMDADLERMKANIESNDSLAYNGRAYTVSTPGIDLGPYEGQFDHTFQGLTLVKRPMPITVSVLPYDC